MGKSDSDQMLPNLLEVLELPYAVTDHSTIKHSIDMHLMFICLPHSSIIGCSMKGSTAV